jgi:hypothetical protein
MIDFAKSSCSHSFQGFTILTGCKIVAGVVAGSAVCRSEITPPGRIATFFFTTGQMLPCPGTALVGFITPNEGMTMAESSFDGRRLVAFSPCPKANVRPSRHIATPAHKILFDVVITRF